MTTSVIVPLLRMCAYHETDQREWGPTAHTKGNRRSFSLLENAMKGGAAATSTVGKSRERPVVRHCSLQNSIEMTFYASDDQIVFVEHNHV